MSLQFLLFKTATAYISLVDGKFVDWVWQALKTALKLSRLKMKTSSRKVRATVGLFIAATVLSACQSTPTEGGLPEDFDVPAPDPEPLEIITIWAPEAVSNALSSNVEEFEESFGVEVQFTNLELEVIFQRLQSGVYPDVFFGTHSWTEQLVSEGLVAELELGVLGERIPKSLKNAFSVGEDFYGVAVSEQHVSLICNPTLVPEQPTEAELAGIGIGLALDPNLGDPYHLYPFMSSFGVDLIDPQETDFGSAAGYEFAAWMTNQGSDLFDLNNDYQTIADQFNSGEIGCWLSGPWALASVNTSLRDSVVVYEVPAVGNLETNALVDVAGFFVSAQSDDPVYANRLVLENFTESASQLVVARSLTGIPAVETADDFLSGFRETAVNTTPTSNSEFMNQLWPLLGSAQAELLAEGADSVEIWTRFVTEVDQLRGNAD